ncbi:MAG: transporter substrate-binding domain-containing protein [bacterium]
MRKSVLLLLFLFLTVASISISAERTLLIGITDTPPLVYEENGKTAGFFIDIIEKIADEENWTVFYKPASLEECIELLSESKIDLIADIGYSAEREKNMNFNETNVLMTWAAFYTKKGVNIVNFNDLSEKRIAVEKSDFFIFDKQLGLESTLKRLGINYSFVVVEGYREVLNAVKENKADVGVVNKIYGAYTSSIHRLSPSDLIFLPVSLRYASPKNDSSVIKAIDRQLKKLKEDKNSIYYKSLSKHILPRKPIVPIWFLIFSIGLISALVIASVYLLVKSRQAKLTAESTLKTEESSHAYTRVILSQLNKTLYDILDAMPIGILSINENYDVEYSNREADKILFLKNVRKDISEIIFMDSEGNKLERLLPFKNLKNSSHYLYAEKFMAEIDGNRKMVIISGVEFYDPIKKKKHGLFTIEDLTGISRLEEEKRAMEDKLLESQRIESMGHLVGGIADDFDLVLSAIQGNAERALKSLPENCYETSEHLNSIINSAALASNFANQLFLFGRKQLYAIETLNINKITQEFVKPIGKVIRSDIEIETNLSDETYFIKGDFNLLRQTLLNLVINARDAIGEGGGKIKIETFNRTIKKEYSSIFGIVNPGNYACISVSDTGKGMDSEFFKKTIQSIASENIDGGRLGLSIVNKIVKREGGFLEIDNIEGAGSTVRACFPDAGNRQKQGN